MQIKIEGFRLKQNTEYTEITEIKTINTTEIVLQIFSVLIKGYFFANEIRIKSIPSSPFTGIRLKIAKPKFEAEKSKASSLFVLR